MQRSDQFWDGWKQLALQLAETRQIYHAVVQVHIRVGKKAASTSNPPDAGAGGLISEGTRRVARRFPNTVQLPLELTVVPTLTHRYRRSNLEAVHAWWLRWGDSSLRRSESVEWVPFLYLALDYMLNEPRIRPLAHRRQWADGVDRPWPFQPTMVELSRSFHCILKAYWKSNRVSICSEVTRSVVPGCDCWLMCAHVAWPSDRLDMVCELIRGQLGHGIRTPGDVKLVVDPSEAE